MNKLTLALIISLAAGLTTWAADKEKKAERREQRETKLDIDKHIHAINTLDNNPTAARAGMTAISHETAVPLPTIEQEHKQHSKLGLAGLFVAHELSTHTHKPVEHFIKAHDDKTWTEILNNNNQDIASVDAKLSRIESTMRGAKP